MGQKVSPEIFRVKNLNNNWKSKYIENKSSELSNFFFKSLEIKNFIKQFIKFHGLTLHNCKIALSNTSLHLIVSYYVANRASVMINKQHAVNNTNKTNEKTLQRKKKAFRTIKRIIKIYYYKYKRFRARKNKKLLLNNFLRQFKKKISFKYLHFKRKLMKKKYSKKRIIKDRKSVV
jgi:hypothetical protein